MADEIAGKKRRAANADEDSAYGGDEEEKVRKRRRDEDIRKVVENHNVCIFSINVYIIYLCTFSALLLPLKYV